MEPEYVKENIDELNQEAINDYGELWLEGNKVIWRFTDEDQMIINLTNVVIVGEWTNDQGPFRTDWYLVLVEKNGNWVEIPMYAIMFSDFLKDLGDYFGTEIKQGLIASAELASRIIWPEEYQNNELFDFVFEDRSGVFARLRTFLIGDTYHLELVPKARKLLVK